MKKEEIIEEVGRPILRPLGLIQGVFLLAFLISPILWIWIGWTIAWKVGLTGLIGSILIYWIYKIAKQVVTDEVNNGLGTKQKSRFQERLEQLVNERKEKLNTKSE